MVQIIIGCVAFLMFFIGDLNDWKKYSPVLKLCFPTGIVLMVVATAWEIISGCEIRRILLIFPAAIFLFLLIYTLFFAIPANDAYVSQHSGRSVCNTGAYALCRHPGVLCFLCLYICLYFMGIVNIGSLIIFNVLNLLLVLFEDKYVFPDIMSGYDEYKKTVPFLIPGTKHN